MKSAEQWCKEFGWAVTNKVREEINRIQRNALEAASERLRKMGHISEIFIAASRIIPDCMPKPPEPKCEHEDVNGRNALVSLVVCRCGAIRKRGWIGEWEHKQ